MGVKYGEMKSMIRRIFLNDVSISFYRYLLGVSKQAPRAGIVGELGRYPIQFTVIKHMLNYWHRLVLSDDILLRAAYTNCKTPLQVV